MKFILFVKYYFPSKSFYDILLRNIMFDQHLKKYKKICLHIFIIKTTKKKY